MTAGALTAILAGGLAILAGILLATTTLGRTAWGVALASLRHHRITVLVTAFAIATAAGLVLAVFQLEAQTRQAFLVTNRGFDAVVGERSAELPLVLNSVYHLEASPGNISWREYLEIRDRRDRLTDERFISRAVPYALGDNYRGFRVIGTTLDRFAPALRPDIDRSLVRGIDTLRYLGADDESLFQLTSLSREALAEDAPEWTQPRSDLPLAEGRPFDDGTRSGGLPYREAVIGNVVAQRTGLGIGDTFQPSHGLVFEPGTEHAEVYTVVGIAAPTNSPDDRVIWIPLEGIWRMEGHELRGAGERFDASRATEIPIEHREISLALLQVTDERYGQRLDYLVNRSGEKQTFVYPIATVMVGFLGQVGWVLDVIAAIGLLVLVVAGVGMLASLTATMRQRRRQVAILRALGARRSTVWQATMLEAGGIGLLGAIGSLLVAGVLMLIASEGIRASTGIVIDPWAAHEAWLAVPIGTVALAVFVGMIPAVAAYRTNVADHLHPTD